MNLVRAYISTPPTKIKYAIGERFDPTGMIISGIDTRGNPFEIDEYNQLLWKPKRFKSGDKEQVMHLIIGAQFIKLIQPIIIEGEDPAEYEVIARIHPDCTEMFSEVSGNIDENHMAVVEAVLKEGYEFLGWFDDQEVKISDTPSFTFEVEDNAEYFAKAKQIVIIQHKIEALAYPGCEEMFSELSAIPEMGVEKSVCDLKAVLLPNHKFLGWFNINKVLISDSPEFSLLRLNQDETYYAKAELEIIKIQHRITFDPNGGEGVMDEILWPENEEYTIPVCKFTIKGEQHFAKWMDQYGNEYVVGQKIQVLEDMKLSAVWSNNVHMILYKNSETCEFYDVDVPDSTHHIILDYMLSKDPAVEFLYWEDEFGKRFNVGDDLIVTEDYLLMARFNIEPIPGEYTVMYLDEDSQQAFSEKAIEGTEYTLRTNMLIEPETYKFTNWLYKGESKQPGDTIIIDTDLIKIYPVWSTKTINISYRNEETIAYIDEIIADQDYVVKANEWFTPEEGYEFKHWKDANGIIYVPDQVINTHDSLILTPVFDRIKFVLTYTYEEYKENDIAYFNEPYTIKDYMFAVPEKHKFSHWLGSNGTDYWPGDVFDISEELVFEAIMVKVEFEIKYFDEQSGEKVLDEAKLDEPYIIKECSFIPPEGFRFDYWAGPDDTKYQPGEEIQIDSDIEFIAKFIEQDPE